MSNQAEATASTSASTTKVDYTIYFHFFLCRNNRIEENRSIHFEIRDKMIIVMNFPHSPNLFRSQLRRHYNRIFLPI